MRQLSRPLPIYIILLTAKTDKESVVAGFQSGADDYVSKPFDREELRARVKLEAQKIARHHAK